MHSSSCHLNFYQVSAIKYYLVSGLKKKKNQKEESPYLSNQSRGIDFYQNIQYTLSYFGYVMTRFLTLSPLQRCYVRNDVITRRLVEDLHYFSNGRCYIMTIILCIQEFHINLWLCLFHFNSFESKEWSRTWSFK